MASCTKGYQALPLLTFHRRRAGGEPGNEVKSLHCVEPMVPNCYCEDYKGSNTYVVDHAEKPQEALP